MTVGKDVRCVVAEPCRGGWRDSLWAPSVPRCLRGVFVPAFVSDKDRASCWLPPSLLRREENVCVRMAVWQAGARRALAVTWLGKGWSGRRRILWGLLPLPSGRKQKLPLSLHGRGPASLPRCRRAFRSLSSPKGQAAAFPSSPLPDRTARGPSVPSFPHRPVLTHPWRRAQRRRFACRGALESRGRKPTVWALRLGNWHGPGSQGARGSGWRSVSGPP